ncbi:MULTISPECIES: hypothetical protein [Cupriavidus]
MTTLQGQWIPNGPDKAILFDGAGKKLAVRTGNEICTLADLRERVYNGERGDDVPILMEDFGCDYELACELVFEGSSPSAGVLLDRAVELRLLYGTVTAREGERAMLASLGVMIGGHDAATNRFFVRMTPTVAQKLAEFVTDFPAELHARSFDVAAPYLPAQASREALLAERAYIDYTEHLNPGAANQWAMQRDVIERQLPTANQSAEAPAFRPARLFVEATSSADYARPDWAMVDLTPSFVQRIMALRQVCRDNELLSVRAAGGPTRWDRATEWRPDIPALIVSADDFKFEVHPKLAHGTTVESASVPIKRLLQLLQAGEVHNAKDFRWNDGVLYYANDSAEYLQERVAETELPVNHTTPDLAH